MKKKLTIALWIMILLFPLGVRAQDIWVNRFEPNYTSLIARMNQVRDNADEACAVLRCYVRGDGYTVEPNLGIVKDSLLDGEIRLWVSKGTKRLTIRHKGLKPLIGYVIPIRLEQLTDYDVDIESIADQPNNGTARNMKESEDNKHRVRKHPFYMGAGYNIISVSGPSLNMGVNIKHHNIELGAVYGLNKTDDLFFYDSNGNTIGGYNYNAICAKISYGYEIKASDYFAITPMIGASYLAYMGSEVEGVNKNTSYEVAYSLSVIGGLRLTVAISEKFKLCLTPEYHAAAYKDKTSKLVSKYDDKLKSWHTGFNLNVGFMFFF